MAGTAPLAGAPDVTAVVVAFGAQPLLEPAVHALLASTGVTVEVVVVDNGCTDGAVARVEALPGVRVLESGANLGFAAGCDTGVALGTGRVVALVNPDAVVAPDALAHLVATLDDPTVGIASASLRLAEDPTRMNSAGNRIHLLGFSWCGALGEPAADHDRTVDVPCASGAAMATTRAFWDELGGFPPEYFAYYEDAELSLRTHLAGRRVLYVADAVVTHHYEFGRHPSKLYLAERNRLVLLLTVLERRTLVRLAPVLALVELGMLGVATIQGWGGAKLRGWWWLVRHRRWLRTRRGRVQMARTVGDDALLAWFDTRLADANVPLPPGVGVLDAVLAPVWRRVAPSAVAGEGSR